MRVRTFNTKLNRFRYNNRESSPLYQNSIQFYVYKEMTEEKNRTFWYWNDDLNDKITGMIIEKVTLKRAKLN